MDLRQIFGLTGLPEDRCAVIFHRPSDPALRRSLPWLAAERGEVFDAYQSYHNRSVHATLARRELLLSFIETPEREHLFVGLYDIGTPRAWREDDVRPGSALAQLSEISGEDLEDWKARQDPEQGIFDLMQRDEMRDLSGRLAIGRPDGRAYVRLLENLSAPVLAIHRENRLAPAAPDWQAFVVSAAEIRSLPQSWAARLREWRGVYLIVDESDGARYVGMAGGADNLLSRWRAHVRHDSGVTVELMQRDPARFRFSILQRVSPDMESSELAAIESSWKERLHSRQFGLNRN